MLARTGVVGESNVGRFRIESGLRVFLVGVAVFGVVVFAAYRPALDGAFISDDNPILVRNPYLQGTVSDLRVLMDPASEAYSYVGGSFQPVPYLMLALEKRFFDDTTRGYHLVNVFIHVLNSALLAVLLFGSGISSVASLLAASVFLLHPANVEAVAWISQLRTLLAMLFGLSALLAVRRFPVLSVPLFALALCSKAVAVFALPAAAAWCWTRHRRGDRAQWTALAAWVVVFACFAAIEIRGFGGGSGRAPVELSGYPDAFTHVRSIAAYGARYLAMATTGFGASAFHEPERADSSLDLWWMAALVVSPLLLWRVIVTLRRGSPEAGWWLAAAAGFAPISQVVPFFFPMADRYMYFIIPGLLGGAVLAGIDGFGWLGGRPRAAPIARLGCPISAVAAVALIVWFGIVARDRAMLWESEERLLLNAAEQYPDGLISHYLGVFDSLSNGETEQAIAHLEASGRRGGFIVFDWPNQPLLRGLHSEPRYWEVMGRYAGIMVDWQRRRGIRTHQEAYGLAQAHFVRDELDEAIGVLYDAIRTRGPMQEDLAALHRQYRLERAEREKGNLPARLMPPDGAPASQ